MNTKTQTSQFSSIELNQILNEEEFRQILGQKDSSIDLDDSYINQLLEQQHQEKYPVINQSLKKTKKPSNYDSQTVNRQKKMMELAYERSMKPSKLLANPIFRVEPSKEIQSHYYGQGIRSDYFAQYIKWKAKPDANRLNSRNPATINHKRMIEKIRLSPEEPQQKRQPSKNQSFSHAEQLNGQIKKIHEQYLKKVTQVTSKNILPTKNDPPQIQIKGRDGLQKHHENSALDLNEVSEFNPAEALKLDQPQSVINSVNEEVQTEKYKFQQPDINEYCFQNMIKRKPDFINSKPKSRISPFQVENREDMAKKDIQQEYLFQKNSQKPQQNESSLPFHSIVTKKTATNPQVSQSDPRIDPYYHQLKQMIRSGFNAQSIINKKQVNKKQIPINQAPNNPPAVWLNVDKLLKLPYKQFVIFFDQNHRKIISMTQPAQYKRLQAYQAKCLEHAASIDKLRERFSSQQGARLIQHLPIEQKQKLFKVLYQNQV